MFRAFAQQDKVDQTPAAAIVKSCDDIYEEVQKVLRGEITPGSIIRIDTDDNS